MSLKSRLMAKKPAQDYEPTVVAPDLSAMDPIPPAEPADPPPPPMEPDPQPEPELEPEPEAAVDPMMRRAEMMGRAAGSVGSEPGMIGRFRMSPRQKTMTPQDRLAKTWGSMIERSDSILESLQEARQTMAQAQDKTPADTEAVRDARKKVTELEERLDAVTNMVSKLGQYFERK